MSSEVDSIIEKIEQDISSMGVMETANYLLEKVVEYTDTEYSSEISQACGRLTKEKLDSTIKQVMFKLAINNITDYDEVLKYAFEAGLPEVHAKMLAEAVGKYETEHIFNARELSKVDFRKYGNNLLIVSYIDKVTQALIIKAGFKMRPDDNSMIVYCYIDHIYGIRFEYIASAKTSENGEIIIGLRDKELSLKLNLDSFDGKVEAYPGEGKVSKDMIEKIQKLAADIKVSDSIDKSRMISELDELRIPGYPDDVIVCFTKDSQELEDVICRIEDLDKDGKEFKVKILNEPSGSYGKHVGDVIDASLVKMENGNYRLYSYFKNDSSINIDKSSGVNTRILSAADFIIRTTNYQCTNKNHELIRINAIVRVMNSSGVIEVELPAYYCRKCDRYYILESDYSQLKTYGYICCRVDTFESLMNPDYNYFGKLNEKSILMNYGYSVEKKKELSEEERHEILSFMIDNNILKKNKIIDYLNWFININKKQSNKQNAITKWKKDIEFIQAHQKVEENVYAKSIKVPIRRIKLMEHNDYVQTSIEDFL